MSENKYHLWALMNGDNIAWMRVPSYSLMVPAVFATRNEARMAKQLSIIKKPKTKITIKKIRLAIVEV